MQLGDDGGASRFGPGLVRPTPAGPHRTSESPRTTSDQRAWFVGQLQAFRHRLLSTDARSPTIFLGKCSRSKHLDVSATRAAGTSLLSKCSTPQTTVPLVLDRDETPEASALRAALVPLQRTILACAEDTGVEALHVGVCWVEGLLEPDVYVRAPLLLLPCALRQQSGQRNAGWHLAFESDGVLLNSALLALVKTCRRYELPTDFEERLAELFASVREEKEAAAAILSALGELHFPATGTLVPPRPLTALSKRAALERPELHPLRLVPYTVLGLFEVSSTTLHADLGTMVERALAGETDQGIVDNLLDTPADDPSTNEANLAAPIALDDVPDARLNLVVPSDPSQEAVILRADRADCVVVRGPPGTGKSQVIVNLVANALSRNQRVAVVCQKRVALDVVRDRLATVGLGDAAFLVHDPQADLKAVYRQIATRMDASGAEPPREAEIVTRLATDIDASVRELRELIGALAAEAHGIPVSSLYAHATPQLRPVLDGLEGLTNLTFDQLPHALRTIRDAQPSQRLYDAPTSPVHLRRTWADLDPTHADGLHRALRALVATAERTPAAVLVSDGAERDRLALAARRYEDLKGAWYRFFVPSWHSAAGSVRSARRHMGSHDVPAWPVVLAAGAALETALDGLRPFMEDAWLQGASALVADPAALARYTRLLQEFVEANLGRIQEYDRAVSPALRALFSQCAERLGYEDDWSERTRAEVLNRWIGEAEHRYPQLRGDPLGRYEKLRATLDAKLLEKRSALQRDLPRYLRHASGPLVPPNAPQSEVRAAQTRWNKLRHEVGKQRQHWSLRKLVREFDGELRALTRCWLCLPEVVSDVFPLDKGYFDLVIFDEASQLAVERALPVLYRGKRVVVAGDEKQMPPSNWFTRKNDDGAPDDDGERHEALRAESLLEAAKRIYGFSYLEWHYRSEHQELIDFSNHAFYDGKLHVAANISFGAAEPPIRWVAVKGQWVERRNLREAQVAVDLLHQELVDNEHAHRSVGIITMNQPQEEAVQEEIKRRRETDPLFAELFLMAEKHPNQDERPVIKNIENVQGDERDVIIFSIGYAEGPDGVFRRQFGALSAAGGENRLNVAVTRAKRRVYVICSFDPCELAVDDAKNIGPARFQQYLRYAKAVSERDTAALSKVREELGAGSSTAAAPIAVEFDSPFEEDVYNRLRDRGYELRTQWGFSGYRIDIAVVDPRNPSRFCLGVECDGAAFHSGRSVRERDIARQRFLERRGWRIARIWSRSWWRDPHGEIARVCALLPPARV